LFDIISGTLRHAWDFRAGRLPQRAQVEALLPLVGWHKVRWKGASIELPQQGMELDFGGFGKEYAADRAATLLQEHGVRHGMVNLGGDIRLMGPQPDGHPWRLVLTFSDESVRERLAGMTLLRVDVTANNEQDRALMRKYSLFGPPALLFFAPAGEELSEARVIGFQNAGAFRAHLDRIPASGAVKVSQN